MLETTLSRALKYRWVIFWILAFGYVLVYFHRQCTAVLAVDMMKDLKTDGNMMGLFGSFYFYPYALMQLPSGLLSDSLGPRKTITIFFIIAVFGSFIMGVSTTISLAIVGRTMVGIGIAMLFVPTMKIFSKWFRKTEFAHMTAIFMTMGGIGALISTTPLAFLSSIVGWRFSFVIISVFTLFLTVLVWLIVRDNPSNKGFPLVNNSVNEPEVKISILNGIKLVIKNKNFWLISIWFFFTLAIFFSFGGLWGGPYLMHIYKLSKTDAGYILAMLSIGLIIGGPVLSVLSNKFFKSRKKIIIITSFITLLISGLLAFNTAGFSKLSLYYICLILGVSSSAVTVISFTYVKELFPLEIAGTSTGLVNLFPFAGGAVLQQIIGAILENYGRTGDAFNLKGYETAFLVLFVCSVIALISSLLLKDTFHE